MLCKKHFENLSIWASYIEFLFEVRDRSPSFTAPKTILQRSLQALPKSKHIAIITKFGGLEYKHSQPESGRTMFEGVVTNYPKRMDVWAVYMDMETKYGQPAQARHLFERCLALEEIRKKPKKMKLVFRKYMEFENEQGNSGKLGDLRKRVEQYLEQVFKNEESGSSTSESDME
jgi:rRNA biogenesis protein RRP5